MSTINIPTEELQALLGKAILEALTTETRDLLILEAIKHLNTQPTHYGRSEGDSPLVAAFKQAVTGFAREAARDIIEEHHLPALKAEWAEMLNGAPEEYEISTEVKVAVMTLIFNDMREKAKR